jgi:hypothetical protein
MINQNCETRGGLESIGFQKLYNRNPETMYGLTYYYTAPEIEMKGSVSLDDGVHEIEGVGWFEHQWGNFRNTEATRYFWGYARSDNGDTITWRQYYGNPVGKLSPEVPYDTEAASKAWKDPHHEVNRFAFIPKGQARHYSFGPAFVFTPIKWWASPKSGAEYPWWGELKTPQGTFYLSPTFPAQESTDPPAPSSKAPSFSARIPSTARSWRVGSASCARCPPEAVTPPAVCPSEPICSSMAG